jgi:hypothetical protein
MARPISMDTNREGRVHLTVLSIDAFQTGFKTAFRASVVPRTVKLSFYEWARETSIKLSRRSAIGIPENVPYFAYLIAKTILEN